MYDTHQKVFEVVVRHLRKQAAKAMNGAACTYRSPEGLKCAVGCLIPDEHYDPRMENRVVRLLLNDSRFPVLFWMKPFFPLLQDLQLVHDQHPVSDWEARLAQVATRHALFFPKKES